MYIAAGRLQNYIVFSYNGRIQTYTDGIAKYLSEIAYDLEL